MDSRPCLHGQALRGGNGGGRRWVPASAGQRRGGTMDSRPCLHGQALRGGNEVGRRWVPASARTTEGRDDGFPPLSSWAGSARGQRSGEEMGPRIREDNGGEWGGWVPASAGTTEVGPGSARGQRRGEEMGPRIREDNGGERRWVPAPRNNMGRLCAGATKWGGDGSPHPRGQRRGGGGSARGQRRGEEMGPRIREDNGWVPASAGTTEGREALVQEGYGTGLNY